MRCRQSTTKALDRQEDAFPYTKEDGPQVSKAEESRKLKVICWEVTLASN